MQCCGDKDKDGGCSDTPPIPPKIKLKKNPIMLRVLTERECERAHGEDSYVQLIYRVILA